MPIVSARFRSLFGANVPHSADLRPNQPGPCQPGPVFATTTFCFRNQRPSTTTTRKCNFSTHRVFDHDKQSRPDRVPSPSVVRTSRDGSCLPPVSALVLHKQSRLHYRCLPVHRSIVKMVRETARIVFYPCFMLLAPASVTTVVVCSTFLRYVSRDVTTVLLAGSHCVDVKTWPLSIMFCVEVRGSGLGLGLAKWSCLHHEHRTDVVSKVK